ncbi:receptor-transporting protein 4-like [Leptodactylus fuscus]|uniref:receptor-transporting protein 4-like n=1 Tax=Leptodactylus fuscus TaxID=238119 RepID=UPI003F4F3242
MEAETWEEEFYNEIEERGVPGDWEFYEDENLCMEERGAKYTQRTFGRFRCSGCKRRWNSAEVHVLFLISLNKYTQQGTVKMRIFRQECKKCSFPELEEPEISYENVTRIIKNLVNRILLVFYGAKKAQGDLKPEVYSKDMEGPHDKEHCEACKMMICRWQVVATNNQTADRGSSAGTTSSYVFPSTTIYPAYESNLRSTTTYSGNQSTTTYSGNQSNLGSTTTYSGNQSTTTYSGSQSNLRSTTTYSGNQSNLRSTTSHQTERFTRSSSQYKEEESSFPIVASLIAGIGALALWYFKR